MIAQDLRSDGLDVASSTSHRARGRFSVTCATRLAASEFALQRVALMAGQLLISEE